MSAREAQVPSCRSGRNRNSGKMESQAQRNRKPQLGPGFRETGELIPEVLAPLQNQPEARSSKAVDCSAADKCIKEFRQGKIVQLSIVRHSIKRHASHGPNG